MPTDQEDFAAWYLHDRTGVPHERLLEMLEVAYTERGDADARRVRTELFTLALGNPEDPAAALLGLLWEPEVLAAQPPERYEALLEGAGFVLEWASTPGERSMSMTGIEFYDVFENPADHLASDRIERLGAAIGAVDGRGWVEHVWASTAAFHIDEEDPEFAAQWGWCDVFASLAADRLFAACGMFRSQWPVLGDPADEGTWVYASPVGLVGPGEAGAEGSAITWSPNLAPASDSAGSSATAQSPAWKVGVPAEVLEGFVEEALEWGRFGEPISWFTRFHVARGTEQEELAERIGSYWTDVRVVRVDLDAVDDAGDVHRAMVDGRWSAVVPYRPDWVASRLVVVAVLGPPAAPDAVLIHASEFVEGDPPHDIVQLALVLPNERTSVTEPTMVWLPPRLEADGSDVDPEILDERALALPVTDVLLSRAFRALQSSQRISLVVDYARSFPVCPDCWRRAKHEGLGVQLFSSHEQAHHAGLGVCVDAGLVPLLDVVVERVWSSYAGCQGEPARSRSGYLALRGKLPADVLTALQAAGCHTLEDEDLGTAIYWDPEIFEQVLAAVRQGDGSPQA